MKDLLTAAIPWPYRVLAIALLATALVGFGYVKGLERAAAAADKADVHALQGVIKTGRKQQAVTASVAAEHEAKREQDRVIYRTINHEVIRYVQASTPAARCQLDVGWLRLHDAAALSTIPGSPGESDAPPSGISASDALETIVGNYETGNETRQQLIDLQHWITEQRAIWPE